MRPSCAMHPPSLNASTAAMQTPRPTMLSLSRGNTHTTPDDASRQTVRWSEEHLRARADVASLTSTIPQLQVQGPCNVSGDLSGASRMHSRSIEEHPGLLWESGDPYLQQRVFHQIDTSWPGLQLISRSPYIFLVANFLNSTECERLIALQAASVSRGPSALTSEQAEVRTSTTAIADSEEVGWLRKRVAELINVSVDQLDPTKITHYSEGEFFGKHIDAAEVALGALKMKRWGEIKPEADLDEARQQFESDFEGPGGLGLIPDRYVSVFVYLNDVSEGGRTTFSNLQDGNVIGHAATAIDLLREEVGHSRLVQVPASSSSISIAPRAGMAVVHFPTTTTKYMCLHDASTIHESEPAVAPKFITQHFVWSRKLDEANAIMNEYMRSVAPPPPRDGAAPRRRPR